MSELDDALYRAGRYNNAPYHAETNPYGHTGKGGTLANWVRSLTDGVTIWNAMAALYNSINFVAERAAVAEIYRRCQDLVPQITTGSTSALNFPSADKLLASASDVVAVYAYDTRLDDRLASGGRWNEPGRCAHLSWHAETLGTSTRGIKRDFPLVALLVLRSTSLIIYDALDLDPTTGGPRMWMVFPAPTSSSRNILGISNTGSRTFTTTAALNGRLYVGGTDWLCEVNFATDRALFRTSSDVFSGWIPGTIAQRAAGLGVSSPMAGAAIAGIPVNFVRPRVQPGAPLDQAGLPIPTIAAATDGGFSVVHPTGLVANITGGAYTGVAFFGAHRLCAFLAGSDQRFEVGPLPYASVDRAAWRQGFYNNGAGAKLLAHIGGTATAVAPGALGTSTGVSMLVEDEANPANGLIAHIATSFATGWLPGDIRLAALCDATTGSITGSGDLIVNGRFDAGLSGWVASGNAAWVGGVAQFGGAAYGGIEQALTTVVGQTYLVPVTVGGGPVTVSVGTVAGATDVYPATNLPVGAQAIQFTATRTTTYLKFYKGSTTPAGTVDEVSCRLAVADRSYKGKGTAIYGTPQRNPVATGAEVVLWSGWASDAYLEQPYNSDLDVGTGDFWVALWTTATTGSLIERGTSGLPTGLVRLAAFGGSYQFTIVDSATASGGVTSATPTLLVAQRVGGVLELWVNDTRVGSATGPAINTNLAGAVMRIGCAIGGSSPASGGITMVRWGAGALSPAQIRRIFRDEVRLMRPDAKCLLAGSNTVTALDRDPLTDRLLVCTGAGSNIFRDLNRAAYHSTSTITSTTSNSHKAGSLRGGTLLLGTAAQAAVLIDALGGKEAILAGGPRPVGGGFTARGVTTDATPLDLAPRVYIGERETVLVEVRIVGRVYGGVDTERLVYVRKATVYRDAGGAVTLQGSVQTIGTDTEVTSTADANLQLDTISQTVSVRVTGVSGKRISWSAVVAVTRISEEATYVA
ncbi:hypothetical protein D3093_26925 (plasmid) [Azospirillum argentinense]|uniref:Uncharacterized protein n=1 Tax=Azospirillum argentinense TaxID=2970906 RepID=A0A4D8PW86_9PROT|nr:hypothetical protein [Azospirillum argentinense]QCN98921.1 hypothetical protein D3093_26925 [Azospirillum argentinense]